MSLLVKLKLLEHDISNAIMGGGSPSADHIRLLKTMLAGEVKPAPGEEKAVRPVLARLRKRVDLDAE